MAFSTRVFTSSRSYCRSGRSGSAGTITAGSWDSSTLSADEKGDVDSMVLMRTIVLPRRFSSEPTSCARSASEGSWPSETRSFSGAASSSRRTRRTPRGQASLRSASIMAPRMRRSAKVSNLMPRESSKRWAASMRPITPSCTRSLRSIEWGMVAAIRRAKASTNGIPASTRGLTAFSVALISFSVACPKATAMPAPCRGVQRISQRGVSV